MNWRHRMAFLAVTMFAALQPSAMAQTASLKEQLVGAWTLTSVADVYANGRKVDDWGPTVKGAVSFDRGGRFMWTIIGANNLSPSGSPRQASTAVIAYFGTFTIDETAKSVTLNVERSTFPSMDGRSRKTFLTIQGDDMTQNSEIITTPTGNFYTQIVFKRAK